MFNSLSALAREHVLKHHISLVGLLPKVMNLKFLDLQDIKLE
jgi:hypothetical protein